MGASDAVEQVVKCSPCVGLACVVVNCVRGGVLLDQGGAARRLPMLFVAIDSLQILTIKVNRSHRHVRAKPEFGRSDNQSKKILYLKSRNTM